MRSALDTVSARSTKGDRLLVVLSATAGTTNAQVFVYALCASVGVNGFIEPDNEQHTATRSYALSRFNEVIWTASHLLTFAGMVDDLRSLNGRALRNAIAGWYNGRSPEKHSFRPPPRFPV